MLDSLGFAAYVSSFDENQPIWETYARRNAPVFLSLHISEEFSPDYCDRVREICRFLRQREFSIIADVSPKTARQFQQPDLCELAKSLDIWALRVDYGFSPEEIAALAARMPVVVNASTTTRAEAEIITAGGGLVMAMHNFYPRPETGLDAAFFRTSTAQLQAAGLKVLAFIPGDAKLRGPMFQGLPTLEHHRFLPPSVCYADLKANYQVDGIFLGDPALSDRELARIQRYEREGIWEIPAYLEESWHSLYGRVFTCRPDSPASVIRFAESREYSCQGQTIVPDCCVARSKGCITVDNVSYGRYTGEVQLLRADLPGDTRVNVVGTVKPGYGLLADCVKNGQRFVLTKA